MEAARSLESFLKDKGLNLVAINNRDEKDVINKDVKEGGFTFPIVMAMGGVLGAMRVPFPGMGAKAVRATGAAIAFIGLTT